MELLIFLFVIISPFIMALSVIDFDIFGLKLSTIIPIIILLINLFVLLFRFIVRKNKIKFDSNLLLLLLFFLFALIKFLSSTKSDSLMVFISGMWVILYFLCYNLNLSKVELNKWIMVIDTVWLISLVIGIILYILNIPLYSVDYVGTDKYYLLDNKFRAMGTFVNANAFGYFTVLYFLLISIKKGKYYMLKLIIILYTLIITYSRSALLIFFVLFLISYIYGYLQENNKENKSNKYLKLSLFNFAIGLSIIVIYVNSSYFFGKVIRIKDVVNNARWEKWAITYNYIFKNLSNFIFGNNLDLKITSGNLSFSDNQYLYLMVYYGLIGLLILSFLFIKNIFYSVKRLNLKVGIAKVNLFKLEFLIAISIMAFVSNIFLILPISYYIPIIFGVMKNYEINLYKRNVNR